MVKGPDRVLPKNSVFNGWGTLSLMNSGELF